MRTTIEVQDGLLNEGETLEFRKSKPQEEWLTFNGDRKRLPGVMTTLIHVPVIIKPFNLAEWANTHLFKPMAECWVAMDRDRCWYKHRTMPRCSAFDWSSGYFYKLDDTLINFEGLPVDLNFRSTLLYWNGKEWVKG